MCGTTANILIRGTACMAAAFALPAWAANGVVGPGNCNQAGFDSVLAAVDGSGGGTITFNCGTATIVFTNRKAIAHAVVIDGGGSITLDGGGTSALFQIYASANVTLRRLTLQHGVFNGGHMLENFGSLRLREVTVRNNISGAAPLLNQNSLVVEASTFADNTNNGAGSSGHGGAILNDGGPATIRFSTFSNNTATTGGGAIYSTSTLNVSNSTFSGNRATASSSGGGAIYVDSSDAGSLVHVTIADNSGGTFGGGFYSANGALFVSRSIIANNANGNCDGMLTSGGYNVWAGSTSCALSATGDGAGNPMLGALANNGGPTWTRMPGNTSAAINRIPNAQCVLSVDQRGGGRPAGNGCDSGAVEAGAARDLIFYDGFE